MKRKGFAILLVLVLVMLGPAAGVASAKTTTKTINFNLDTQGQLTHYVVREPLINDTSSFDVTIDLTGKILDKNGGEYLLPLKGIITIDGEEHWISVKQAKQAEPIFYYKFEFGAPGGTYYMVTQWWKCFVEINTEGNKYVGTLEWQTYYVKRQGIPPQSWEKSYLEFFGVKDGKMVEGNLRGDGPVIE